MFLVVIAAVIYKVEAYDHQWNYRHVEDASSIDETVGIYGGISSGVEHEAIKIDEHNLKYRVKTNPFLGYIFPLALIGCAAMVAAPAFQRK